MTALWPAPDGTPIACRDKVKMLEENAAELNQVMQDAFEDAILMGVDEPAMRAFLTGMVAELKSPRR